MGCRAAARDVIEHDWLLLVTLYDWLDDRWAAFEVSFNRQRVMNSLVSCVVSNLRMQEIAIWVLVKHLLELCLL